MPRLYLKEVEPFIITSKSKKGNSALVGDGGEGANEQKLYTRRNTKRNTSLVVTDAVLVCLEFLQVLALIQAMSLKWIWPKTWIRKTNFIFFFTADVWEYIKVDSGAFIGVRNYDAPSSTVTTTFYYILVGWGAFFTLMALIFGMIKLMLHLRQPAYLLMYNARLLRAFVIITQIIALPFGVTAFKVFHCTDANLLDVDNVVECWTGFHWAYVVPVVVVGLLLYVVFPVWLFWRIHHESMASAEQHHEDFLKLKEVEYMSGLDMVWAVKGLYLFSSFHLRAIYYRPVAHLAKVILLVIYAASFQDSSAQGICFSVALFLAAVLTMILRPYRLMLFNVVTTLGYFCLMGDTVFGAIIAEFNPTEVESPWLVEPYSIYILVALNGVILCGIIVVFLIYLLAYRLCCQGRCVLEPLWPVLTAYEYDIEGTETQKYLGAVLRGRALLEKCRRLPMLFVPVHELAHQICILNAYMRESELTHDGLHPTLWAVLDEMIDMHRRLEPKSLFGEMVQESIRKNAAHFMTLMPMFSQRMAQRDYDLILVSPLKKRLLLKMYIIAMLLDGSRKRRTHQELTQQVLTKIWEDSPELVEVTDKREYHEELYPPPVEGPDTEALYSTGTLHLGHGLYDLEEAEDEEESLSAFLKRAPPKLELVEDGPIPEEDEEETEGTDNPAFVPDGQENPPDGSTAGHHDMMIVDIHGSSTTGEADENSEISPENAVNGDGRESTVELGYDAGESSTDGAADEASAQGNRGRSNTDSSVTSALSRSSQSSTNQKSAASGNESTASARSSASSRKSAKPAAASGKSAKPASAKTAQKTKGKKKKAAGKQSGKKK